MVTKRVDVISGHVVAAAALPAMVHNSCAATQAVAAPSAEDLAWEPATNFFTGKFTPVNQEADRLPCEVEGKIPNDLRGIYLRNGPNPRHVPKPGDSYHYFDGDGMIVSVEIGDGGAKFSHKWVRTERYASDEAKGSSVYEFGSMAVGRPVFHETLNEGGQHMGKANTSVIFHEGRLYAMEEADQPYRIGVPSLQTIGKDDFAGTLGQSVFTAHPKIDPDTKEMIGYGSAIEFGKSTWKYAVVSPAGAVTHTFGIELQGTSYNHDFAITKTRSIVFDGSLVINWKKMMKGKEIWEFNRARPGRIGVFPRYAKDASEVKWFDVEPFCVSHTVNAFDEGDEVVIIANNIGFEGFKPNFSETTPKDPDANLHEWRLNTRTGAVREQALRRIRSDFPSINPAMTGKPFRYAYVQCVDYAEPQHYPYLFGCYKYDLQSGSFKDIMWHGADDKGSAFGGECIFAPKANAVDEDDGYVLVQVNNVRKRRSELRIYDAKTLGDAGSNALATVVLPRRVIPMGTHGTWLVEADAKRVSGSCS